MTNASMIDVDAVALALVAALDDAADLYGGGWTASVPLPDGRHANLRVRFDADAGLGRWIDGAHHDDIFGMFAWRGTDRETGHPSPRPDGFDGRAEVLCGDPRGDRWSGDVWWQPTEDDTDPKATVAQVRAWMRGDWFHVGLVVEVSDPGAGCEDASVWGFEWDPGQTDAGKAEAVAELLREAGIEQASTAAVPSWARESVDAVARRLDGDDDMVRELLTWWESSVEARGDWDTFGGPMTDAMQADFEAWRERMAALPDVDLDDMTDGYIEAALWADCMPPEHAAEDTESGGRTHLRVEAPTWAYVRALVGAFAERAGYALAVFCAGAGEYDSTPSSLAGYCLRMNSGGHGVGFWDREPRYLHPDPRLDEYMRARAVLDHLAGQRPFDRSGAGDVYQVGSELAEFERYPLDPNAGPGDRYEDVTLTSAQRQAWIETGHVPAVEDTFPVGEVGQAALLAVWILSTTMLVCLMAVGILRGGIAAVA